MKLFILCSMLALAAAVPVDQKISLDPPQKALDINKPPPFSSESNKQQIPINKPLFKRDSPVDQKNNAQPANNAQKNSHAQTPAVVKQTENNNKRPSRDTPKAPIDSYKPQASGVPQRNAQAPSPISASSDASKNSNIRPSRDTPKVPVNTDNTKKTENAPPAAEVNKNTNSNTRPKRDTPKTPVTNQEPPKQLNTKTQSTPDANKRPLRDTQRTPEKSAQKPTENAQKNAAPAPSATNSKPQQGSRVTRDTPKPADNNNNQKPVVWNKDEKKVENKPAQQADRKTRETPKKEEVKDDKVKSTIPVQHPEVAKVPLTNSRNRRDAPNPHEQSKLVPSGAISGNPSVKARDDSTTQAPRAPYVSSSKRETEKQSSGIHYPVPVSEVLKKKDSEIKPANDNSKPADDLSKKQ